MQIAEMNHSSGVSLCLKGVGLRLASCGMNAALTADNRALRACAVATGNELEEVPLA